MGTGFYGSNDPTNSVKALKELVLGDVSVFSRRLPHSLLPLPDTLTPLKEYIQLLALLRHTSR